MESSKFVGFARVRRFMSSSNANLEPTNLTNLYEPSH